MAIVQGASITMDVDGQEVSATMFYDDVACELVRIDTVNDTGRDFQLRLTLTDGSFFAVATIAAGANSVPVAANLSSRIDPCIPDNDDATTPANPWLLEISI